MFKVLGSLLHLGRSTGTKEEATNLPRWQTSKETVCPSWTWVRSEGFSRWTERQARAEQSRAEQQYQHCITFSKSLVSMATGSWYRTVEAQSGRRNFEKRKGKGDTSHAGALSDSGDTWRIRQWEIVDCVLGESRNQFGFRNVTLPTESGGYYELFVEYMVTV